MPASPCLKPQLTTHEKIELLLGDPGDPDVVYLTVDGSGGRNYHVITLPGKVREKDPKVALHRMVNFYFWGPPPDGKPPPDMADVWKKQEFVTCHMACDSAQ